MVGLNGCPGLSSHAMAGVNTLLTLRTQAPRPSLSLGVSQSHPPPIKPVAKHHPLKAVVGVLKRQSNFLTGLEVSYIKFCTHRGIGVWGDIEPRTNVLDRHTLSLVDGRYMGLVKLYRDIHCPDINFVMSYLAKPGTVTDNLVVGKPKCRTVNLIAKLVIIFTRKHFDPDHAKTNAVKHVKLTKWWWVVSC
uniref:Uncharacterized protein n=1 Tax=Lygus hesperus TaxID=30085 RepID=A0A146M870_LYGHE